MNNLFSSLATPDLYRLLRGVLILCLIVMVGVAVAEHQMNALTQWNQYVSFFNLRHNTYGVYSFYVLGHGYSLCAVYRLGTIYMEDQRIFVHIYDYSAAIPTKINADISALFPYWQTFLCEFKDEAYSTKDTFATLTQGIASWMREKFFHIKRELYRGGLQVFLS